MKIQLNPEKYPLDTFYLLGLGLVALVLFTLNLGNLPLRDWDEGTIAQVAKEIWQAPPHSLRWLFPTLLQEPYFNKPPLIHGLMALAYACFGVNEFSARLPGALFSAFSVPLLYWVGVELFSSRQSALLSALVYLTFFPILRHGRLAMLDGTAIFFFLLMLGCILRARRDIRWSFGAGIGFSLIYLTKATLGLLLAGIAFLFLAWDTPGLLLSGRFWLGWGLGCLPSVTWFVLQVWHYQQVYLKAIQKEYFARIFQAILHEENSPILYLRGLLQNAFPWLAFWLSGLFLAARQWRSSWGKLVLIWSGVYLLTICLMETKLSWYILPIYPALALSAGAFLAQAWQAGRFYFSLERVWVFLLALGSIAAILYLVLHQPETLVAPWLPLEPPKLTLLLSAVICGLAWRSREIIVLLIWGMLVSLLLFFHSAFWVWELNEAFPVKPVAFLVQQSDLSPQIPIYMIFDYERPSLNFYSGRKIQPRKPEDIQTYWRSDEPIYGLTDPNTLNSMNLTSVKILGKAAPNWVLFTKK